MAGLVAKKPVKKTKKHGVKAGQKSLVRPSQKKSVKNGRHQEKETPKAKITKTKAAMPAGLDGQIVEDDEFDDFLQEPQFDESDLSFDSDVDNLDEGDDE